jgi:hypothetical protein
VRQLERRDLPHLEDLGAQQVPVLETDLRRRALEVDERPAVDRHAAEGALQARVSRLPARERQAGGDGRGDDQDGKGFRAHRSLRRRSVVWERLPPSG